MRALFYWIVVAIPLTWGVLQSVNAALPLFGAKSVYISGFTVPPPPPAKPAAAAAAATPAPAAVATPIPLDTSAPTPAASDPGTPTATVTPAP